MGPGRLVQTSRLLRLGNRCRVEFDSDRVTCVLTVMQVLIRPIGQNSSAGFKRNLPFRITQFIFKTPTDNCEFCAPTKYVRCLYVGEWSRTEAWARFLHFE